MKKGIAIQTILLLLLGVLVAGILIYLVYTYTAGSGTLSATDCRSELTTICTLCSLRGWSGGLSTEHIGIMDACNDLNEFSYFPPSVPAPDCGDIQADCGKIGVNTTI